EVELARVVHVGGAERGAALRAPEQADVAFTRRPAGGVRGVEGAQGQIGTSDGGRHQLGELLGERNAMDHPGPAAARVVGSPPTPGYGYPPPRPDLRRCA